jgi:hypothetical protein
MYEGKAITLIKAEVCVLVSWSMDDGVEFEADLKL